MNEFEKHKNKSDEDDFKRRAFKFLAKNLSKMESVNVESRDSGISKSAFFISEGALPLSNNELGHVRKLKYRDFYNKVSQSHRIFTKEEVQEMTIYSFRKNKDAINFQKSKIGLPSEEQALEKVREGILYKTKYADKGIEKYYYFSAPG